MLKLWLESADGARKSIDLLSLEEARPQTRDYIQESGIGLRLFMHGLVYQAPYEDTRDILALVSYNGRIDPRGEAHVEEYLSEILPSHRREGFCTLPPWAVKLWKEFPPPSPGIVSEFQARFVGDPLADVLVTLDHQLSTDSDLDEITGAAKYQALRQAIRDAMARKLGFSGYLRA